MYIYYGLSILAERLFLSSVLLFDIYFLRIDQFKGISLYSFMILRKNVPLQVIKKPK